jgi:septal ring-binding cell division protein DamX
MILFGQPELDDNLAKKSIRQLRERITHSFHLSPLNGKDIHRYLNFRMREVGYTGPELISYKLAVKMARYSEGLLRRINILADKMLLSAFSEGTHTLTIRHLKSAMKDSDFTPLKHSKPQRYRLAWGAGLLLLVLVGAYFVIQGSYFNRLLVSWSEHGSSALSAAEPLADRVAAEVQMPDASLDAATVKVLQAESGGQNDSEAGATDGADSKQMDSVHKADVAVNKLKSAKSQTVMKPEMMTGLKKNQQSPAKLDKVIANQPVKEQSSSEKYPDYKQWLENKIATSKEWLRTANKQSVSIQVLVSRDSAARDLVQFLRTEWPLDLDKTYLFVVKVNGKKSYRVFYNEYPSITLGQTKLKQLPEAIQVNSPYLHSVYRMQKAFL